MGAIVEIKLYLTLPNGDRWMVLVLVNYLFSSDQFVYSVKSFPWEYIMLLHTLNPHVFVILDGPDVAHQQLNNSI